MKSKKRSRAKKQKLNPDQKNAVVIVAFLLVGSVSFLTGAQAQKINHENNHVNQKDTPKHTHTAYAVYELPASVTAPTVGARLAKDSKGGYNVFLDVTNFRFMPKNAGKANIDGEGHAHIYVDDVKVARLYGTAYYLDTAKLSQGPHTLRITLTTNDHKDIAKDGGTIEARTTFLVE